MEADAASRALHMDAPASRFVMNADTLDYWTEHALQFIDITDEVRAIVERSGVHNGQVTVFSRHTTAAVDRKSTRLNSSHVKRSRMPSSA
mgnify:CR=1 FL=1